MVTARSCCRRGVICCVHVSLDLLKLVGFGESFRNEVCIEIHFCGRMVPVVLKVPGDDIERVRNRTQKSFARVRHGGLICGIYILEFLIRFL